MKRANQQGLGYEEPQEFAGQGEVVAPGKSAESYLRALGPRDEDVALLDKIKLLTWREELNAGIRKKWVRKWQKYRPRASTLAVSS